MPARVVVLPIYSVVVIFLFLSVFLNLVILKTSLLPSINTFIVSSGSMNPSLNKGNLIYTQQQESYKIGDIITFRDEIGRVTHRIIGVKKVGRDIYFQTKGDANKIMDEYLVSNEKIYGKVILSLPFIAI